MSCLLFLPYPLIDVLESRNNLLDALIGCSGQPVEGGRGFDMKTEMNEESLRPFER